MKSVKFLTVVALVVGFSMPVFGSQINLNINLPDLQMSVGSYEGEKGGDVWSQIYADLRLTFGTIQQTGVYYNPEYVYDSDSSRYEPSPNKGWVNINFSGPATAPLGVEDYKSQQLGLNHGGINFNESISSYTYIEGEKGIAEQMLTGPIWSCANGSFYGNFHVIGSGNSSFYEYTLDSDNGKSSWFTSYAIIPVQWDVLVGTSVPAMGLASSPVPEPSTFVLMVIGLVAGIGVYLRHNKRS